MPTNSKAVVAGASGRLGRAVVSLLLQRPEVDVCALVRTPTFDLASKLTEVPVDYERLHLLHPAVLEGADVICCLGSRAGEGSYQRVDFEHPRQLALLAQASRARSFTAVTTVGASPHAPLAYYRVKGELERELRSLSLPVRIVRPSQLYDQQGPAWARKLAGMPALFPGKLRAWKPLSVEECARTIVHTATGSNEAG